MKLRGLTRQQQQPPAGMDPQQQPRRLQQQGQQQRDDESSRGVCGGAYAANGRMGPGSSTPAADIDGLTHAGTDSSITTTTANISRSRGSGVAGSAGGGGGSGLVAPTGASAGVGGAVAFRRRAWVTTTDPAVRAPAAQPETSAHAVGDSVRVVHSPAPASLPSSGTAAASPPLPGAGDAYWRASSSMGVSRDGTSSSSGSSAGIAAGPDTSTRPHGERHKKPQQEADGAGGQLQLLQAGERRSGAAPEASGSGTSLQRRGRAPGRYLTSPTASWGQSEQPPPAAWRDDGQRGDSTRSAAVGVINTPPGVVFG